jgi:hypothetical protein
VNETKELLRRGVGGFEPMPDAFDRVLARRDRKQRNQRVAAGVLGIVVFALAAIGLVQLLGSKSTPGSDPRSLFEGTWVSTSDTGITQTMTVRVSADGAVEITVRDDAATVCHGAPSTMTGTGRIEGAGLVIPSPVYTCDDGSEPEALSGPPLEEQLRNLTFVLDAEIETLRDNFGGVWQREGAEDPSTTEDLLADLEPVWPQTSLEEVRQAQELADAGDPRYTWQVDPGLELERAWREGPYDAEIFARFLREELGWEEFQGVPGFDFGGGTYSRVDFIRCAPGRTNPVYPNDPSGGGCAPTLDGFRYETVRIDVAQPGRQGATGIWVVTRWKMIPFEQVAPPSEAETTALLEAFLQARIDGEGAGEYVDAQAPWGDEIPFLYATPTGAPYERSEFEVAEGPLWPDGRMRFKVRLFAENGQTVVEQSFQMDRVDRGLWYEDETDGSDGSGGPGTTVNGQDVPVPYSLFDGQVTLSMTYPWHAEFSDDEGSRFNLISDEFEGALQLLGPGPVRNGCQQGPAPADAEALARSIRSNPGLEATAPVTVSVGGIPALQMDVTTALSTCPSDAPPKVAEVALYSGLRIRLYLLDLPQGSSARMLAIAFIARKESFERAVESAAPIVDSVEFHTG